MAKKEKQDVLIPYKFLPIFETLLKKDKGHQVAELVIAIIRYDQFDEEPIFTDDSVVLVWESVIKPQLDEYKSAYQKVVSARIEAGRMGGIKANQNNQMLPNATKCYQESANVPDIVIDSVIDNDSDIDKKEKIYKKEKPTKHKYGAYGNVLLSDADMVKLKAEFPTDWEERIERVSEYCASHGRTYRDYLATIRTWARKDKPRVPILKKNDVQGGLEQALALLEEQDG